MHKAVFLNKDGTLIEDIPYNIDPSKITLAKGAGNALKLLQKTGYKLIVVSNESGVGRGIFDKTSLWVVEKEIYKQLEKYNVKLDGFYYCPHYPAAAVSELAIECQCQKPRAGLLFEAAADQDIDLNQSWMIGDKLDDIEAGNRAGCQTILLANGGETQWNVSMLRQPQYITDSLEHGAGTVILRSIYQIFRKAENQPGIEQLGYQ